MVSQLTRSPQINELLRIIEQYLEGHVEDDLLERVLYETTAFIENASTIIEARVKVLPPTQAASQGTAVLQDLFARLTADLHSLREAFESGHSTTFKALADSIAANTDAAMLSSDRLQAIEVEEPVLSNSPYLNGLMKIARAIDEGRTDGSTVGPLLASGQDHLQSTLDQGFANAEGREAALLEEHSAAMDEAFQDYWNGLEIARQYTADGNTDHLHQGLEQANQAYDRLMQLQGLFQPEPESAPAAPCCLRCGAENAPQSRVCQACGATLPHQLTSAAPSSIDVRIEDGYVRNSGHTPTPTGDRLTSLVNEIRNRRLSFTDLLDPLDQVEGKLRQSHQQLKRPEQLATQPAELESLQWAYDTMVSGIADMLEAIDAMRRAIKIANPAQLDLALDAFLSGADKVARVQQASQQG